MNKLVGIIEGLGADELTLLRKDIAEGNLLKLVDERLARLEDPNKVCPVCHARVNADEAITLTFGPKGLRQRASFDGEDCLRYFTARNV